MGFFARGLNWPLILIAILYETMVRECLTTEKTLMLPPKMPILAMSRMSRYLSQCVSCHDIAISGNFFGERITVVVEAAGGVVR